MARHALNVKTVFIQIRATPELREKIKQVATLHNRGMSGEITKVMEHYVNKILKKQ